MKNFEGRVAVITGAASGIGFAIAKRCIQAGMKVVIADIEEAALHHAELQLRTEGGLVLGVRTDVSKRSDVERLAHLAVDSFGARRELASRLDISR